MKVGEKVRKLLRESSLLPLFIAFRQICKRDTAGPVVLRLVSNETKRNSNPRFLYREESWNAYVYLLFCNIYKFNKILFITLSNV